MKWPRSEELPPFRRSVRVSCQGVISRNPRFDMAPESGLAGLIQLGHDTWVNTPQPPPVLLKEVLCFTGPALPSR